MTEVWCFACYGAGYIQVSNVNIVCPTCKGKGTLNKGEQQMSEEETIIATVTPFDAIQKQIDTLKSDLDAEEVRSRGYRDEMYKLRNTVHEFFKDQFDGGDEEITVHRDEANELLGDIGADLLKQEFEGRVTITYSFTVKAESVEDAEEKVKNAVGSLEYSIDADADDEYSEDSIEVEF
jgi:DnaJ-class molecular chaperone